MQALGAPPPDLQHGSYPPPKPPPSRRPGGGFLRDRGKLADYTLKGLGLLGVALVSGFLWYLIRNNPATPGPPHSGQSSSTSGLYSFQAYEAPSSVTDCVGHTTDSVQAYLRAHPCTSLTRSLFTTSLASGDKVVTSVAVVQMNNATAARGLRRVSDAPNTGHIKDLVEDGTVVPGGPTSLQSAGSGYYSEVKGNDVIVVMTEYANGAMDVNSTLNANTKTLLGVSADAAKQGIGIN